MVPVRYPHPLINAPGFEVSMIKWCSMHCVNLGILQNLNGSLCSLLFSHGYSVPSSKIVK